MEGDFPLLALAPDRWCKGQKVFSAHGESVFMTQQVLIENLQRAGKAGHLAGAGVLGGIEAVVVERCSTDFDGPARIQAIAALSHGVFLLTACRFAGSVVLEFDRKGVV